MGTVRPGTDADSAGVIALIAGVFREYPGCVLDVDREEPGLRAPASAFDRFWVLEEKGRVAGCVACAFAEDHVELKKLYLEKKVRGRGHARRLVALVEEQALARGVSRIELWSDTRFADAHGLYEHLGYEHTGRTRDLHDLSDTTEFHYVKRLVSRPA
jgi:putative acetyltransferase